MGNTGEESGCAFLGLLEEGEDRARHGSGVDAVGNEDGVGEVGCLPA